MSETISNFDHAFTAKQVQAYGVNKDNGWWREREEIRNFLINNDYNPDPHLAIELLGLCHSELSEAVEAARKHPVESWSEHTTKDTMVREMAGCIVRLMDMAEYFRFPLAKAIEAEIEANRGRGFKHGGKAA